jgi:hypothetical protein
MCGGERKVNSLGMIPEERISLFTKGKSTKQTKLQMDLKIKSK